MVGELVAHLVAPRTCSDKLSRSTRYLDLPTKLLVLKTGTMSHPTIMIIGVDRVDHGK